MPGAFRVWKDYRHQSREFLQDFRYTIYDRDKWPHPKGEGGWRWVAVQITTRTTVLTKSEIGPYDVHEMLHVHQNEIGALPYAHIFLDLR